MNLTWKNVSMLEGLELLNLASASAGSVLTSKGHQVKRYSFRHRKSDGQRLLRWGRLDSAEVCWVDGRLASVIFTVVS